MNIWVKRPTRMKRVLHMYGKLKSEAALQNARKLILVADLEQVLPQKRHESMGKETYTYEKRPALQNARKLSLVADLEQVLPQKRPESMGKETYIYEKRR